VLCYDANASPIRAVQRSGRTGRSRAGRVVHLLAAGKEERQFKKQLAVRCCRAQFRSPPCRTCLHGQCSPVCCSDMHAPCPILALDDKACVQAAFDREQADH
jgi:hypothetical protein